MAILGPDIFAAMSCALGHGFRPALALIVGIIIGDLQHLTPTVLGMAARARSLGGFFS